MSGTTQNDAPRHRIIPQKVGPGLRLVSDVAAKPDASALRVIEMLAHSGPHRLDDIEDVRRRYEQSRKPLLAPLDAVDSVFHVHPHPDEAPAVTVIRPQGSAAEQALPAIVYLHGGGWTVGTFEIYEPLADRLPTQLVPWSSMSAIV